MHREHVAVLAAVARACAGRAIVVIGATALRWHYPKFRGTLDLDLCIAIDLAEHGRGVGLPPQWTRLARLREFVDRIGDPDGRERHWLLQVAPAAWRADDALLAARLQALCAGLGLG